MSRRGGAGRAERDAETARTVNISSELVLMHGASHGFRDSGARLASSPPPPPPPTAAAAAPPAFFIITEPISPELL